MKTACSACGPATQGPEGFQASAPDTRLDAILAAARNGDPDAARDLVEQLDSDDPAVRLAAISALERLFGTSRGYVHYDSPSERDAAVIRWVEALAAQRPAGPDADGGGAEGELDD